MTEMILILLVYPSSDCVLALCGVLARRISVAFMQARAALIDINTVVVTSVKPRFTVTSTDPPFSLNF